MTRDELRRRALYRLGDDPDVPTFHTTAMIYDALNEALEIMAEDVQAWKRTVYIPKADGQQLYDMRAFADDTYVITRVWDQTYEQRLEVIGVASLDQFRQRWWTVTSTYQEYWYSLSPYLFGVYPGPAGGAGVLRVEYLAWPSALEGPQDEPEIHEADHEALIEYATYIGLMQQWEAARATERFTAFLGSFTQGKDRHGVGRTDSRRWARTGQGGRPAKYFSRGVR